jgi:hypothetical protein
MTDWTARGAVVVAADFDSAHGKATGELSTQQLPSGEIAFHGILDP